MIWFVFGCFMALVPDMVLVCVNSVLLIILFTFSDDRYTPPLFFFVTVYKCWLIEVPFRPAPSFIRQAPRIFDMYFFPRTTHRGSYLRHTCSCPDYVPRIMDVVIRWSCSREIDALIRGSCWAFVLFLLFPCELMTPLACCYGFFFGKSFY